MKKYYFPDSEPKRVIWLNNFHDKLLATYASTFGISVTQMGLLKKMIDLYIFLVNIQEQIKTFKQDFTKYKNHFAGNPFNSPFETLPTVGFTYAGALPGNSGLFALVRAI